MKLKNVFIIAVIIAVLGITGFLLTQNKNSAGVKKENNDQAEFSFKDAIGNKAPDFTLSDINGKNVNLSDFLGKNVILFFNEGIMCYPACLNQIVELSKDERFNNEKTVVFSVVADSTKNWQNAQKDFPYLFGAKVLFDPGAKISRLYDVLRLASSMHKGMYPGHTYFIIDKEGVVRFSLDDPNMAIRNDQLAGEIGKL